jgi:hypothetical protein
MCTLSGNGGKLKRGSERRRNSAHEETGGQDSTGQYFKKSRIASGRYPEACEPNRIEGGHPAWTASINNGLRLFQSRRRRTAPDVNGRSARTR